MKQWSILFKFCWLGCFFLLSPSLVFAAPTTSSTMQTTLPKPKQDNRPSGVVTFTPPTGWHLADAHGLPPSVRVMVVGKGKSPFPPSMNLSTQPFKGTLKDYLKIVKGMNDAQGYEWKDLGTIQTQAGVASLSQVDTKSEWGTMRMMHTILLKSGTIYILTASALKEEFPQFYRDFFAAMKSLRVNRDVFEMVATPQRKAFLKKIVVDVAKEFQDMLAQQQKEQSDLPLNELKEQVFKSETFQANVWTPFKETLAREFQDMGSEWQSVVLIQTEDQLFAEPLNL